MVSGVRSASAGYGGHISVNVDATADAMSKGSSSHNPETDRVAFLNLSKLFAMQLKRSVPFKNCAIFETEADALAWVLSDEPGDGN